MKQRLLIADRDPELCELYGTFLAEMGYDVETSTDGLDCLAKLRQATPAVLVLDKSWEDQRLAERVEKALRATGYGALRTVRVSVSAGVVILGGPVSSFYLKQVAHETALAVPGANQIRNGLDVVRPNSDRQNA